jgi:hypothetical protein
MYVYIYNGTPDFPEHPLGLCRVSGALPRAPSPLPPRGRYRDAQILNTHTHTHTYTHTHTHTHTHMYSHRVPRRRNSQYIYVYTHRPDAYTHICIYLYIVPGCRNARILNTYIHMFSPILNTYIHTTVSKETYYSVKRDLLQCQKRPSTAHIYMCIVLTVVGPF